MPPNFVLKKVMFNSRLFPGYRFVERKVNISWWLANVPRKLHNEWFCSTFHTFWREMRGIIHSDLPGYVQAFFLFCLPTLSVFIICTDFSGKLWAEEAHPTPLSPPEKTPWALRIARRFTATVGSGLWTYRRRATRYSPSDKYRTRVDGPLYSTRAS